MKELPQKNVDFGGGLERTTAAVNNNPDIFEIDSFTGDIRNDQDRIPEDEYHYFNKSYD